MKPILLALIGYPFLMHTMLAIHGREYFIERKIIFWPRLLGTHKEAFWATYWGVTLYIVFITY